MASNPNHTFFEYLYRDAANFKAWGGVLLTGTASQETREELNQCLDSGVFFVAEQVSIPALYEGLYAYSNGATVDDHAYHEFSEIRLATHEEIKIMTPWGSVIQLMAAFRDAKDKWNVRLSPHCYIP